MSPRKDALMRCQFTIFRVLTLSVAQSRHSQDHCRLQTHIPKHSHSLRLLFHVESIPSVNPTLSNSTDSIPSVDPTVQFHGDSIQSVDPTLSITTTKHACEMGAEHPVFEDHTTHVRLLCHGTFENLLLPPKSWRLERPGTCATTARCEHTFGPASA